MCAPTLSLRQPQLAASLFVAPIGIQWGTIIYNLATLLNPEDAHFLLHMIRIENELPSVPVAYVDHELQTPHQA